MYSKCKNHKKLQISKEYMYCRGIVICIKARTAIHVNQQINRLGNLYRLPISLTIDSNSQTQKSQTRHEIQRIKHASSKQKQVKLYFYGSPFTTKMGKRIHLPQILITKRD